MSIRKLAGHSYNDPITLRRQPGTPSANPPFLKQHELSTSSTLHFTDLDLAYSIEARVAGSFDGAYYVSTPT